MVQLSQIEHLVDVAKMPVLVRIGSKVCGTPDCLILSTDCEVGLVAPCMTL